MRDKIQMYIDGMTITCLVNGWELFRTTYGYGYTKRQAIAAAKQKARDLLGIKRLYLS